MWYFYFRSSTTNILKFFLKPMQRTAPSPYPDISHCWTGRLLCIRSFLLYGAHEDQHHAPHLYVSPFSLEPIGPAPRSTTLCESLLFGDHEDQHQAPHLYVSPFSLELMRTSTALHSSMWALLFGAHEDQYRAPHLYVKYSRKKFSFILVDACFPSGLYF